MKRPIIMRVDSDEYPACPFQVNGVKARLENPDSADSDNLLFAFRLNGEPDRDALDCAIRAVMTRHEPLRTVFRSAAEFPLAHVLPVDQAWPGLHVVDLSPGGIGLRELAGQIRDTSFDIERGPVLRVTLARQGEANYVLLVCVEHGVCDGLNSLAVFSRDLGTAYGAMAAGTAPDFPAAPLRYRDFAVTLRQWLGEGAQDEILAFWKARLPVDEPIPSLPLITRSPQSAFATGVVATQHYEVPGREIAGLNSVLRSHKVSRYILMVATLFAALRIMNRAERVGMLTSLAYPWPGIANTLGHYANLSILACELSLTQSLSDVLNIARDTVLCAVQHCDMPFGVLMSTLCPEAPPALPVFLSVRTPDQYQSWHSATVQARPCPIPRMDSHTSHPGLKVVATLSNQVFRFAVDYPVRAFRDEEIASFIGQCAAVLTQLATDPGRRLGDVGGWHTQR